MQAVFETFLERISESIDEVDFRDALADAGKHLGLPTFAYLVVPAKSVEKPTLISNYPLGWTSYYLSHRYDEIDPVIQRARCGGCPFHWRQGCCGGNTTQAQQRMLNEAAEFGIASGLTIPIHDLRGGFAALTFATDERNPEFLRAAEKYELALQLMATCFHVEVRRTAADDQTIDGIRLTPREYECLQWAVAGKSTYDIATILAIRRRTVAFHLDNAKEKLGVRTINQAVARFSASRRIARR